MTRWVERPEAGRPRGPAALARAWVEVVVRPRRFFRDVVVPGDQAPGLVFAMVVVGIEEATRFALVPGAYPVVAGRPLPSAVFWLGLAVLVVAPLALHLAAALQTLLLLPVDERGGVSETVQVIGYATAPCVVAGVPVPEVRVLATAWGAALLALGIATVHGTRFRTAAVLSALPAAAVFGYGFRGFDAVLAVLRGWAIL